MKILIVAGAFPPYCPASTSRVNKLAKYLEDHGHDVQVLAPKNTEFTLTLLPEVSSERIHYTAYSNINEFPTTVINKVKALTGRGKSVASPPVVNSSVPASGEDKPLKKESAISILYRYLTNIPDDFIGWYPDGVKGGKKLFESFHPDIIFSTSPPFTATLVACRLGRLMGVPVVNDYRDLLTDHPYYDSVGLRRHVERFLENYALKQCAGLVTVTKTWADYLTQARGIPVECAMNGFDPADFKTGVQENYEPEKITLLYAGYFYGDKRDPSVLFEALGALGDEASAFNVLFYTPKGRGDFSEAQNALIKKYHLENIVQCHVYIPQKELLALQQKVDILLQLRWDDPSENGVIAGKLFEYIGAGKPILSLGSTTGEAADIVRDNGFGLVSNDGDEVSRYLMEMLDKKRHNKPLAPENPNREKFTRAKQFEKIVTFLEKIIADTKSRKGKSQ